MEPQALIMVGKPYAKAHAPTCTWALAIDAKSGAYTSVPVSEVPPNAPNCRHCGGPQGRR